MRMLTTIFRIEKPQQANVSTFRRSELSGYDQVFMFTNGTELTKLFSNFSSAV